MEIDVAGQSWTLETFDPQARDSGEMGRCDSKLGLISLSSDITGDVLKSTIIHEWLHGVFDIYGLGHTEAIVNVMAVELMRRGFRIEIKGGE